MEMVQNQYTLSGHWAADGNTHVNTAKLWSNYFSPELQGKFTDAGSTGDPMAFGAWAVFALGTPDSTDAVKASPTRAASTTGKCGFTKAISGGVLNGAREVAGTIGAIDLTVPNRVAFTYDVVVPVSLTEQGNAEGVLTAVLKVDLSFVPNPNARPGKPDFLINSINNALGGTTAGLLTNHSDLLHL
jgi:hypothetical protein